jgi:hypothetical protein
LFAVSLEHHLLNEANRRGVSGRLTGRRHPHTQHPNNRQLVACHASLSARCAAAHNDVDWTPNRTPSSGKTLAVFADKLSSSTNSDQVNVDKVLIKETLQSTVVSGSRATSR